MKTKRLPYVHEFYDRHGVRRAYFRRGTFSETLPGARGSAEFMNAYSEALSRCLQGEQPEAAVLGDVYAIRAKLSGRVKIGFSTDVSKRLAALQTSSPEPLELVGAWPGRMADERDAHRRLKKHRVQGEWFKDNAAVSSFISSKTSCEWRG